MKTATNQSQEQARERVKIKRQLRLMGIEFKNDEPTDILQVRLNWAIATNEE